MSPDNIDVALFFLINRDWQNGIFDAIMPVVTGRYYLFLLILVLWLAAKNKKSVIAPVLLALMALGLSDFTAHSIKHFIGRVRPCNALEGVRLLVGCTSSYSMPSNHAANSFALITPFYIMFKSKVRYAFPVIALLVCFSRVYVGVHYPSDVVAGGAIGFSIAAFLTWLYNRTYSKSAG